MPTAPRVLVDSYNLRLKKGSGIKTYGLSLLEALKTLEYNVSLLTDRHVIHDDQLLAEVSFFDERPHREHFPGLRLAAKAARLMFPRRARRLRPHVIAHAEPPFDPRSGLAETFYNVPQVFDAATAQYATLGLRTRIRVPDRVDIFHATTALPIRVRGAAQVTTIHDVIPLRLPQTTLDDKRYFHRLIKGSLKASDLVLTVSENSKRDLVNLYGVPDEKIAVTWQSIPPQRSFGEALGASTLRAHRLTAGEYVLFVGNIEPKKNLPALIRAMAALPGDLPLVVVGSKAWLWEEAMRDGPRYLGKRFRHLDYLPATDLPILYRHARLMVFPSVYEGFGLPPLEAMANGCAVACSKLTSLPEVCGPAAVYFDPYDPEDIRAAIERVVNDDELRKDLINQGRERAAHFSAAAYAERLAAAYARVL